MTKSLWNTLRPATSVLLWFTTNTLSTYFSKKLLAIPSGDDGGDIDTQLHRMVHAAAILSFLQLFFSGLLGAFVAYWIPSRGESSSSSSSHFFYFLLEARRKKHSAYKKIILTSVFNAIGSSCVNIAYINGSVSLVQIMKTLEPVITYVLSVGILNSSHSSSVLCSIILVSGGAVYTSLKDSTFNYFSASVALLSNFMMPLRNVVMKATLEDAKIENDEKSRLVQSHPTGAAMFSLISTIGSIWLGVPLAISFLMFESSRFSRDDAPSLVLSSIFYYAYNGASFQVLHLTNPVTHSILNVFKRFFSILCSIALFHSKFTIETALGLSISLFGASLFVLSKQKGLRRKIPVKTSSVIFLLFNFGLLRIASFTKEHHGIINSPTSAKSYLAGHVLASHEILVFPFNSFDAPTKAPRTCETTIVIRKKSGKSLGRTDQPFRVLDVYEEIPEVVPLCVQAGTTVGALLLSSVFGSNTTKDPFLLGPSAINNIKNHLTERIDHGSDDDIEMKIVDRKVIKMSPTYHHPVTPDVIKYRRNDDNSGNMIWQYGATRMINPYTVKIEADITKEIPVSAFVIASANSLRIPYEPNIAQSINNLTARVREIDRPTIILGIGIQAEFSELSEMRSAKLLDHQVDFLNEISRRNKFQKSVSVRGEHTEAACVNANVTSCISLGCPR